MAFHFPGATSLCLRSTLALVALPAVAGTAAAVPLALLAPAVAPLGAAAFALGLVKLAYLGTAAAQIGRGLAEQADGFRPLGWRLGDKPVAARAATAAGYWSRFPNAFDSAVLAAALMTATDLLGR